MSPEVRELPPTGAWPDLDGLPAGPPVDPRWSQPDLGGQAWPPPSPQSPPPALAPHVGGSGAPPGWPNPGRRPSSGTGVAIGVFVTSLLVSLALCAAAAFLLLSPDRASLSARSSPRSTVPSPPAAPTDPSVPPMSPPTPGGSGSGSTSGSGAPDWNQVAATVNVGVVDIYSRMDGGIGAGTGMILTADGAVLTNSHVVDGAENINVTLVTTGDTYRAYMVGNDPVNDVAVIRLEGASGLTPIPLGDSGTVQRGDPVVAIGNAGGRGGAPSVSPGKVVALDQTITASEMDGSNRRRLTNTIQVDANVQSGDSGGPLVAADAKVIGMNAAASVGTSGRQRSTRHEGYAIPINKALEIGRSLDDGGTGAPSRSPDTSMPSGRGFLGVQSQDGQSGASVLSVQAQSPAAIAGLRPGDEIVGFDGQAITSADDLVGAIREHSAGDQIELVWSTSSGQQRRQMVTLASR